MTTGSATLDEINQRRKQLQSVLAGTAPETPGPRGSNPKIEEIQNVVASHFNISRIDILSARRSANVVRPRHIAIYLCTALTLHSKSEIGRRFGGRDHRGVIHAVRKIERAIETGGQLALDVAVLRGKLTR